MNPAPQRTVFVVDDDEAVRDSLRMLLCSVGLEVETFGSAFQFLECFRPGRAGCVLLDIKMPGMSGITLQDELRKRHANLPIVFLTGHGDVPLAVRAMQRGAFDFIEKPYQEQRLIYTVLNALKLFEGRVDLQQDVVAATPKAEALSPREHEVLARVLEGKSSRTIADDLNVSLKTVEFHRGRIREKLGVSSLAELFSVCLGRVGPPHRPPDEDVPHGK